MGRNSEADNVSSGKIGGSFPHRGKAGSFNKELDVTEAEQSRFQIGATVEVFSGTQQEENHGPFKVDDDLLPLRTGGQEVIGGVQDNDWEGLHLVGGRVLLYFTCKL